MAYSFNTYGWYNGEVQDGSPRSTSTAPPTLSTTTTPGMDRANWTGHQWVVLEYSEPPAQPDPPAPVRHITKLAFMNRLTDAEAIAIDLASIGATTQAAALRRYRDKMNVALYIDLERADTRAGVQALEAAGLLGEGRALEILDAEIQPHEVPL